MDLISKINAYPLGKDRRRDFQIFSAAFLLLAAFGVIYRIFHGWNYVDAYVTTLLAFSYLTNGFVRRGLTGTLFDLVCRLFPGAFSVNGVLCFLWGMTALYFVALFLFARWLLQKIEDDRVYTGAFFFSLICLVFLIPTTCSFDGAFGRADLIQMAIGLYQVYLIAEKKHEWLTVPLTALNTLFHEGYVIMTFAALLIVILYRALYAEERQKAKYWLIFALNVAVTGLVAALSITVGGRNGTAAEYEAALARARSLQIDGAVHYNLVSMMAGYTPQGGSISDDARILEMELIELPIFLVCFLPALFVFGKGIFQLFRQAKGQRVGLHITAVLLGPALIGIQYAKYCDFGRYIMWLVFYFFIMFTVFAVMGDEGAGKSLGTAYGYSNVKAILVILLMMIYQPLPTCRFSHLSSEIALRRGLFD